METTMSINDTSRDRPLYPWAQPAIGWSALGQLEGGSAMKRLAVLSFTIATLIAPTFSQAASGLDATQPAVEATTKARAASGAFNFDGTPQLKPPPQKPTTWWEWLRFVGGGR